MPQQLEISTTTEADVVGQRYRCASQEALSKGTDVPITKESDTSTDFLSQKDFMPENLSQNSLALKSILRCSCCCGILRLRQMLCFYISKVRVFKLLFAVQWNPIALMLFPQHPERWLPRCQHSYTMERWPDTMTYSVVSFDELWPNLQLESNILQGWHLRGRRGGDRK